MELFLQTVLNAAIVSVCYALIAVGLTLVFGVMGLLNFAHGELYMIGAYTLWLVYAQAGLPFPVGIIAAMAVVAGLSLAMERGLFRHTRGRPMTGLMLAVAMVFILQVFVAQTWGTGLMRHIPPFTKATATILGATVPWQRLIVIPVAVSLLGWLWYFLHRVKQGRALRATAQNSEAASLQGIDINRSSALAMGIGGFLAGAAGALMAPIFPVTPYMGHSAVIIAFMVIVVGGVGSLEGALIASFIFGFLLTFVTTYVDGNMATIAGALLMFFILIVRPRGVYSRAQS